MARPSRKSIGDPNGHRSVYVVEAMTDAGWIPASRLTHKYHDLAVMEINRLRATYKTTQYRIALYARVEERENES